MTDDNPESEGLFSNLLDDNANSTAGDDSSARGHSKEAGQETSVTAGFSDVQYINFGTFTYHLRRDSHDETICGLSIESREFKSSTRKPDLLNPCKPCHGQDGSTSNEEVRKQLRRSLAKTVDTIAPAESNPGTFSESEMIALKEAVPTNFPNCESSADDIRYQLSRGIVGVKFRPEDPTRFTKDELEALENSFEGGGLIPTAPEIAITTDSGFMKRTPLTEFQLQRRGGKGINHIELDDGSAVESASLINPRDHVFCFTTSGQIHDIRGHEIPCRSRQEPGVPMTEFLNLEDEERVIDLITAQEISNHEYIVTTTADGHIKRTPTDKFTNILSTGIKAVDLEETELVGVSWSEGESEVILTSAEGKSIRFEEKQARPMGRTAKGVVGIDLESGDQLADTLVIESEFTGQIVTVTKNGFGKRTSVDEYLTQKRKGKGLIDIYTGERNGPVIASYGVTEEQNIIVVTTNGRAIRMPADEISCIGRNTKGVNIIELDDGDSVGAVTVVPSG